MSFTVGDTAPALTGAVSADLSGAAPTVHIKKPDGTIISRAADVEDAVAGAWSMEWDVDDLDQIGQYLVEVEVVFVGDRIQTFKNTLTGERNSFRVDAQLA